MGIADKPAGNSKVPSTVIIGGGISGLACAYELLKANPRMRVCIIEKNDRAGGVINTIKEHDALIESGPESFSTSKPELIELARELKIEDRIIACNEDFRRVLLLLRQSLHSLPELKPLSFALTDVFSPAGKLRILLEFFLPASMQNEDESLHSFISRRLGNEVLDKIAEPLIGGIYGGDPELLSAKATVGQLLAIEKKYGSLLKGIHTMQKQSTAKPKAGPRYDHLASFDGGIATLVGSLLAKLPENCFCGSRSAVHIRKGLNGEAYTIFCNDNSIFNADYIVLATPATASASLLSEVNPQAADKLRLIGRSPALILNFLYKKCQFKKPLTAFGFVAPKSEKLLISACSFSSMKFAGRAAADRVLLRVFTGGIQKEGAMLMSDHELIEKCEEELTRILGIQDKPEHTQIARHPEAIPQYQVGHCELVEKIWRDLEFSPGIVLAGNSFHGVGLPDCIKSARLASKRVLDAEAAAKSAVN